MMGVVYLRVSTEEQGLGLEAQRSLVMRWCARDGIEVCSEHVDDGVSGAAPLDRRRGLLDAMSSVRRGWVLVVARRDRLARDPLVSMLVEREVSRRGGVVSCADGNGNGEGASDVLMRRMLDAFAEFERAQISMRTRAALAVKRARGERISGKAPFGYRFEGGVLAEVAEEQEQLGLALRMRAEGESLSVVALQLGTHPRTGRPWSRNLVWKVLRTASRRAS